MCLNDRIDKAYESPSGKWAIPELLIRKTATQAGLSSELKGRLLFCCGSLSGDIALPIEITKRCLALTKQAQVLAWTIRVLEVECPAKRFYSLPRH